MTKVSKMDSKLVLFLLQLLCLVQPYLGAKHYLVEVSDPPRLNRHRVSNRKDNENWKDHGQSRDWSYGAMGLWRRDYELERHERCRGLKELCDGRPTCLENISTHFDARCNFHFVFESLTMFLQRC